eukprot:2055831-Pleurochrysis_carterae.AAC.1
MPTEEAFEVVDAFKPLERLTGGEKPVLVVEMDSTTDLDAVRTQSQQVKQVCVDQTLAHGIIVLSDASA